jgi:ribosomal protein S18 acetylase RimI-like enzyme
MKPPLSIDIREEKIATAVAISNQIPEFINPAGVPIYEQRLLNVPHLILVAYLNNEPVGFKVGYQKEDYFYSWMGGVLPKFRGLKIAKQLAATQEKWAKEQGYQHLVFKTRNQHKAMLIFALKNNFNIIGFKEKESIETNRIFLQKEL